MELPANVLVHNETLGVKGSRAILLRASEHGYYEVNLAFGGNQHRVYLPISTTVIVAADPEERTGRDFEIER